MDYICVTIFVPTFLKANLASPVLLCPGTGRPTGLQHVQCGLGGGCGRIKGYLSLIPCHLLAIPMGLFRYVPAKSVMEFWQSGSHVIIWPKLQRPVSAPRRAGLPTGPPTLPKNIPILPSCHILQPPLLAYLSWCILTCLMLGSGSRWPAHILMLAQHPLG